MSQTYLELPAGSNTVQVRMVDTSCTLSIKADSFIVPTVSEQPYLDVIDQCFLIEHGPTKSKVMFDLGVRKDYWNLPPVVLHRLSLGVAVRSLSVSRDVPEVLATNGITVDDICTYAFGIQPNHKKPGAHTVQQPQSYGRTTTGITSVTWLCFLRPRDWW